MVQTLHSNSSPVQALLYKSEELFVFLQNNRSDWWHLFLHRTGCLRIPQPFCLNTAIYRRIRLPTSLKIRRKHNITSACQFHAPGIIGMSMIGTAMIDYGYGCRCFIGCVFGYVNQGTHGCSILTGQIQPFDFYAYPSLFEIPRSVWNKRADCHAGKQKMRLPYSFSSSIILLLVF